MSEVKHVLSPVDYEAWRKGYCPPSEHNLIDQLQFRGARVVLGSDLGETAYWLVIRGKPIRGRKIFPILKAIEDTLDLMAEEDAAATESAPPAAFAADMTIPT